MTFESFFKGLVIGGIAGAIAGVLFAPKSGKETRQQIADSADKMRKKIADMAEHQKEIYAESKDRLKKALDAGVGAYKEGKSTELHHHS